MSIKSNWKKCKLKDLVKINSSSVSKKDNLEHIVYLDTGNITMGKIEELAEFAYSEAPSRAKRKVKENSIVYSMVRPNQRHYGLIKNPTTNLIVSTGFAVLDAKEFADSKYIYYWLTQNHITDLLQSIAENSTSAYPAIRSVDLENLDISLPPLEEQKRIADILGAFDDKIELLQKQNKTLEDMAKALFKSWFVDFDVVRAKQKGLSKADIMREYHLTEELYDLFPSSFADSPLGPIPSGWEVKTLGDVVVCHDSKRVPLSNRERSEKQGPYPYYGATSIMDHVENYLFDGIFLLLGEDGSVVKPDGTPFLQYVFGKIWVNNHAHVLQGKGNIRTEYLYLFLSDVQIQPYVTGAVQAKLNQKNMNSIPLCVANEEIIKIFQGNIDIVFTKIRANLKQIQTLTELRDTLLPRLISGKIRV